eukprot:jgi/Mesvir1/22472/Mv20135-RA.1
MSTDSSKVPKEASNKGASPTSQLWADVLSLYNRGRQEGWVYSTDTRPQVVEDAGVKFVIRVAVALKDKPTEANKKDKAAQGPSGGGGGTSSKDKPAEKAWVNPFLPYDERLCVRLLPPNHVLLLNKFNVVAHHLLVITRDFQKQTDPVRAADFGAVWQVLSSMPGEGGLAFYNSGRHSGRSQPHKHVQIVPLPFMDWEQPGVAPLPLPFQHLITAAAKAAGVQQQVGRAGEEASPSRAFQVNAFPFVHALGLVGELHGDDAGQQLEALYQSLMIACVGDSWSPSPCPNEDDAPSYNMVLTREWMMVVLRSQEKDGPAGVNALGYAGTFLVREAQELAYIRERGPMAILGACGVVRRQ